MTTNNIFVNLMYRMFQSKYIFDGTLNFTGFSMWYIKYIVVKICPVRIYGSSIGRAPIHVNRITVFVVVQNKTWLIG
jgi:hypothetical protein